jgi:hypothetical protein
MMAGLVLSRVRWAFSVATFGLGNSRKMKRGETEEISYIDSQTAVPLQEILTFSRRCMVSSSPVHVRKSSTNAEKRRIGSMDCGGKMQRTLYTL